MDYSRGYLRARLAASVAIVQTVATVLTVPAVWAQSSVSTGTIDASTIGTLQSADLNCDAFCSSIVSPTNQQDINTSGTVGWSTTDDQYCADHGVITNPAVQPDPSPTPSTTPSTTPSATPSTTATASCNVAVIGSETCAQANTNVTRCKVHGTQVETHCAAYETDKGATGGETFVEALDVSAAATCTMACMAKSTGIMGMQQGTVDRICQLAGTSASAAELIAALTVSNGAQKAMGGALSALGVTTSLLATKSPATDATPSSSGQPATKAKKNKDACIAAITLSALAATRAFNIIKDAGAKKKECTNIQGLLGDAGVSFGNSTTGTTTTTSSSSGSGSSSSGTSATIVVPSTTSTTSAAQVAGNTATTVAGGSTTTPAFSGNTGVSAEKLAQSAAAAGGLDGSMLATGLGAAATPLAQQLLSNPATAAMAANGDAAGLLGAALGGSNSAPVAALANLAQAAEQLAASGGSALAAATYGGGKGGPSTGSAGAGSQAEDENPFAKLAGAGADAGTPTFSGGGTNFERPADPCIDGADIWHSQCRGSIFDVISGRINRARDRVESLPWVNPDRE